MQMAWNIESDDSRGRSAVERDDVLICCFHDRYVGCGKESRVASTGWVAAGERERGGYVK